jgi:Dolichyl-phosphate-mannose-protein mannosyltransferase
VAAGYAFVIIANRQSGLILTQVWRLTRLWVPILGLIAVAAGLRIAYARGQGLWGDELFSLALATGHSLEGAPSTWQPALGDFVSYGVPSAPADLRHYLEHEAPAASPARVIRAVLLSDTNPPGYYLALWLWTLIVGTRDISLRLFSVAWAVGCVPILWAVAQMIGGRGVAFAACLLFAVLPLSMDFSIEVRMYSMLWFWSISTAWATLMLHDQGARPALLAIWIITSAAGLLTHYFFAFAWGPMTLWLLLQPGRLKRWQCVACIVVVVLLIAPWYAQVPQSLSAWRVTKDWTKIGNQYRPFVWFVHNALAVITITDAQGNTIHSGRVAIIAAIGLAVMTWAVRAAVTGRWLLIFFWWLVPVLGLFAIDMVQGTYTAAYPRYALAGVPAAVLLVAFAVGSLPQRLRVPLVALMVLACLPDLRRLFVSPLDDRNSWFRPVSWQLDQHAGPDQLVLVHSIPSGILGIARYTHTATPLALWTQQLRNFENRNNANAVAADVVKLTAGYRKIYAVSVHDVGAPSPELDYLRQHAKIAAESRYGGYRARMLEFQPLNGEVFAWP